MHAEIQSVVLVSASPATTDLVRKSCSNGDGAALQLLTAPDATAARILASDLDNPVLLLDADNSGSPALPTLRALTGQDADAPVVLLMRDSSPAVERDLIEAGAADVLPLAEVTYGSLRRALRHALSHYEAQRKLARLALFDPVSGLPTQILFWEILSLAVRRGQRNRDFFSVLLIDFDWSSLPSDIAEAATPVLYKRFAERIKALMRASDTVARFEKSQIVVRAESMPRVEDEQIVAAKILSDITAPTAYGDRYVTVQAAIGIAIYPTSGSTPEALLVRANDALATSRERTTNRFAFG
jgi:diguanylate cyclase (GGDEF)-like protein